MGHATLTTPLLGSFVLRMLELDIAYWLITLASAVPDSRDMVGAHQNLNGSRDLTTPLSGMICHPWATTCYYKPAYKI